MNGPEKTGSMRTRTVMTKSGRSVTVPEQTPARWLWRLVSLAACGVGVWIGIELGDAWL